MRKEELVSKALMVAKSGLYKTHYVMGGCGQSLSDSEKDHFVKDYDWGKKHEKEIRALSANTRAYDCVCFLKSLAFWNGPDKLDYNNATDYTIAKLRDVCTDVSADFTNVMIGECVFRDNAHVGIVVDVFPNGGIMVVEANNSDEALYKINGVYCSTYNCAIDGLPVRSWTHHGKLPGIKY